MWKKAINFVLLWPILMALEDNFPKDSSDCTPFDGCCQGYPIAWADANSPEDCRRICQNFQDDRCKWFAYAIATELCVLLQNCPEITDLDDNRCISGTKEECDLGDAIVLVALGGVNNGQVLDTVEILDFEKESVCLKATALSGREGAIGGMIDNSAIFCGGYDDQCQMFNGDNAWSWTNSMARPRLNAALSQFDQGLLVVGGVPNKDSMEFYDGQKWEMLDEEPFLELQYHCIVSYKKTQSYKC